MSDLKIKVCGMRDADNIRSVEAAGVDMMGFIFAGMSPRCVTHLPGYLPERCDRVGVFVNPTIEDVVARVRDFGLSHIQLHGNESAGFCCDVRQALPGCKIIKAVHVACREDLSKAAVYRDVADYILLENKCRMYGGSGEKFDWDVIRHYDADIPFILSGGIGPHDADAVRRISNKWFYGIDLNSRFEISPAMKDIEQLHKFIEKIRI